MVISAIGSGYQNYSSNSIKRDKNSTPSFKGEANFNKLIEQAFQDPEVRRTYGKLFELIGKKMRCWRQSSKEAVQKEIDKAQKAFDEALKKAIRKIEAEMASAS